MKKSRASGHVYSVMNGDGISGTNHKGSSARNADEPLYT